ncbi:MAG: septum site-determining protein MinC [Tissierellaceae bacterium]
MKKESVEFKGVKEGIFVNVNEEDLSAVKEELERKMKTAYDFYRGTKLLGIKSDKMSPEDLIELKYVLRYRYDFLVSEEDLPETIAKSSDKEKFEAVESEIFQGIDTGMTRFIKGTLRSGQIENFQGNIVIIGDVNPGALIQAGGNIIVLGTLRGVAHAGISGNHDSIVAAYVLQPTQLRIGNKISRPPDGVTETYNLPEIARIRAGEVIIEPYLPNK